MTMDSDLLVPYGVDPYGVLISATEASREVNYCCPGCSSPLVLRAGDSVIRHFAHKSTAACSGETVMHKIAKRLLVQVISEYSSSSAAKQISLKSICSCCAEAVEIALPRHSFTAASEEHRIGEFVCDVVAFRGSEPVLAIEVLVTHSVDDNKAIKLPLPWLELSAERVLESPYFWNPVSEKLRPITCAKCRKQTAKLREVAARCNQPFHQSALSRDPSRDAYLAALEVCWQCKQEILVYWWAGVPFANTEPPPPRPRTVQHRFSKRHGGAYWANTCPHCDALQGDNFLFLGSRPKFKGLPLTVR